MKKYILHCQKAVSFCILLNYRKFKKQRMFPVGKVFNTIHIIMNLCHFYVY